VGCVPCLQGTLNNTTLPFSSFAAKQSDIAFPVTFPFCLSVYPSIPPSFLNSPISPLKKKKMRVGWLRQLIMVVGFLSLLVRGEKEEAAAVVGAHSRSPNMQQQQQKKPQRQQRQRLRHSFDVYFTSKRKVPNASDPLHNR
jgi:hypothetical protein